MKLLQLLEALRQASEDDNCKGLFTAIGANQQFDGLAQVQEIRQSILGFRYRLAFYTVIPRNSPNCCLICLSLFVSLSCWYYRSHNGTGNYTTFTTIRVYIEQNGFPLHIKTSMSVHVSFCRVFHIFPALSLERLVMFTINVQHGGDPRVELNAFFSTHSHQSPPGKAQFLRLKDSAVLRLVSF